MDNFNHKQIEALEKIANQLGHLNANFTKMLKEMEQARITMAKEFCVCQSNLRFGSEGDVKQSEK